jgi:hypothetical protein
MLGFFLFTTLSRPVLGPTQLPIQWVPGALTLGAKRPGRVADHSPPSSAEVKNAWSFAFPSLIRLYGVVFNYAKGQLYLHFASSAVSQKKLTTPQSDMRKEAES